MPSSNVMPQYGAGTLHSGGPNGPIVKKQKQAVAIMMSERRNEAAHGGKYVEGKKKKRGIGSKIAAFKAQHRRG